MENTRYLYLMVSRTDTTIGKIIRFFTDFEYNHVSLSLDPSFAHWVSFARFCRDVPLAGGFVAEDADRFFTDCSSMPVQIFRMEIPESRWRILNNVFAHAGNPECGLIYNTFGALASALHMHLPIAGAYTCLEFANAVLETSHTSIRQLSDSLQPHLIYEGDLHDLVKESGCCNADYLRERTLSTAAGETAMHFLRLARRMVSPMGFDLVAANLRLY